MPTFGASMFVTEYSMQPEEIARAVEESGLDTFAVGEHTNIPIRRVAEEQIPKQFLYVYDPITVLTAAGAVTKRIKLMAAVVIVTARDPIILAKEVASLDRISNGRVILGVGTGRDAEEIQNHGVPFKRRWKVMRERVQAMKALWTMETAEYHGEFVNFGPTYCWPKPLQKGGVPVLIGSRSDFSLKRVAEYADGWCPTVRPEFDSSAGIKLLHEACERAGRRFEDLKLSISGIAKTPDAIKRHIDLGFDSFVWSLPSAKSQEVMPQLDGIAQLAAKFR